MLTKAEIGKALDRLATVYRVPQGTNVVVLGDVWVRALGNIAPADLETAVDTYLRSNGRFFPKPGEIRALLPRREREADTGTLAGRYRAWQFGSGVGDGEPCPVCGSVLSPCARGYEVLHDHQQHYEADIAYIGPRTGPVDSQGRRMLSATGPRPDRYEVA